MLEDSLPTAQITPTFLPELHRLALLLEVPSTQTIMPDLFVAKINYPRNNTGDASSRAGSSAITGRKVSFLVPLLPNNSSCQQLWNQICTTVQLPPCEIEKGSTFKLNAKLI